MGDDDVGAEVFPSMRFPVFAIRNVTHSNDPTTDTMNADWLFDCSIACLTKLSRLEIKSSFGLRRVANVIKGPDGSSCSVVMVVAVVDTVETFPVVVF